MLRTALRTEARRRRPHILIACVVLGLALSPAGVTLVLATATAAAIAAAWLFADGVRAAFLGAALIAAAGGFGGARMAALDRPAAAAPPGTRLDASATLLEHPRPGAFGSTAVMRIESGPAQGLRILARRREREWSPGDPGMRFRIKGFVRPGDASSAARAPGDGASIGATAVSASTGGASAEGGPATEANAGRPGTPGFGPLPAKPNADDFDYAAFLRSRGIGRQVDIYSLEMIGRRGGLSGAIDSIRRRAERGIASGLPPDLAALARGMVLGEDGGISSDVREDFQRSGLAHVLAASGQNVALLCALALPLLMLAGTRQETRVATLIPLIALYVALAGSGASIVRAGVMAAALLVAVAASRRGSAVYVLLLAGALTLGLNPRATGDPGWQLSFAAVGGMLALGPLIQPRLTRVPRPLAEAIGATVAATLATAPLMAHQFGAVSLAALPANLLAFPAVAPITWIGMAAGAVEQLTVFGWPLASAIHELERTVAVVSALALRWIAWLASYFAGHGWAQADLRIGWAGVAGAYAIVAAVPGVVRSGRTVSWIGRAIRLSGATRIGRAIRVGGAARGGGAIRVGALSPASRRAFAAPIAALAVAGVVHAATPSPPPGHLTVDFIDVGQGDATLIRDPTGTAILFDGGVPEARVDRTLRRLGVRRLSAVVATHQSRDHHGGLLQVVKRFPVGLFLDGGDGTADPTFRALEREVDRRRIPRRPTRRGERLRIGQLVVRILWPPGRAPGPPQSDPNPRATVAIVSHGDFDLLLSADAESGTVLPLPLPRVEAMKVPHHGSADTGLPDLLDRLRPSVAVIETGRGNRYGHPRRPTLDALRARVPRVYRTDRDGTVELTVAGDRLAIRSHR